MQFKVIVSSDSTLGMVGDGMLKPNVTHGTKTLCINESGK